MSPAGPSSIPVHDVPDMGMGVRPGLVFLQPTAITAKVTARVSRMNTVGKFMFFFGY